MSVGFGLNLPRPAHGNLREKFARIDFAGAGTLVVATFLLLLGLDRGGNISWRDNITIASLAISASFYLVFVAVELRWAREPFAPKRIVANKALLASYLANLLSNGAAISLIFNVSLYLQAVQGVSASEVGLTLLPTIFGGVIGSLSTGLIMQATGKYYVLTLAAFTVMLAGDVVVALVTGPLKYSLVALSIGQSDSPTEIEKILTLPFRPDLQQHRNWCAQSPSSSSPRKLTSMIGSGLTTTLVALIANAGPEDQAVATAVSYLFRSLGSVVGLSVSTTITQNVLRQSLRKRLTGGDIDEVRTPLFTSLCV